MGTDDTTLDKTLSDSVASLIEVSRIDTLYGDLYLGRK